MDYQVRAARITDVEFQLMGLVPSLDGATPSQLTTSRLGRVVGLVCDKVLDLYRNPQRYTQRAQAMGDINESTSFGRNFTPTIAFTDDELEPVRLRTQRPRFGSAKITPWKISTKSARVFPPDID